MSSGAEGGGGSGAYGSEDSFRSRGASEGQSNGAHNDHHQGPGRDDEREAGQNEGGQDQQGHRESNESRDRRESEAAPTAPHTAHAEPRTNVHFEPSSPAPSVDSSSSAKPFVVWSSAPSSAPRDRGRDE